MSNSPSAQAVTHKFQAEVNQILHLVIHSLYSNKEIFLRELVSNAADALDKLRFQSVVDPAITEGDPTLEIRIIPDPEKMTLTIEDTGIGMSAEELVTNLGTIAHSGSRALLEQLKAKGKTDLSLIGQFGVGFYSAYLVADRVDVVSRPAGAGASAHLWRSDAKDTFVIAPVDRATRGTAVTLHLRADQKEFLEGWRLRQLVTRYSDYVGHPIKLKESRRTDGKDETTFETINRASALWQRPKSEITDEQYDEFYKHINHSEESPLARAHFKIEGTQEFVALLYVPRAPLFGMRFERRGYGPRLFVKRVLVMEHCEDLVPEWMRFVSGVVDSDDLPLNVSRELLQDSSIARRIKKQLVKHTLDLLEEVAASRPEDYLAFHKSFGLALKEGLVTDIESRERLGKLVRYRSSRGDSTSLVDYVARMPAEQQAIYYLIGESEPWLADSPHSEVLRKRGFEVLYMTDAIDEWAADTLGTFQGKPLVSAMRSDLKLPETEEEKKAHARETAELGPLTERIKTALGERVSEVRVSERLTDSPCCLVVSAHGSHATVERLLRESGRAQPPSKRVLEINAKHPVVLALERMRKNEANNQRLEEWVHLLYEQARLTEGSPPEDPNRFARLMTGLLEQLGAER